jgi:hypothetical protein
MTDFRQLDENDAPPWLKRGDGARLLNLFSLSRDGIEDWCRHGIRARFPEYGNAESLAEIGKDRSIFRGAFEPKATYQDRLRKWRSHWKYASNPFGLLRAVRAYLFPYTPKLRIVNDNSCWYTLNPDNSTEYVLGANNWDWDSNTRDPELICWSRMWLIIYSTDGPWDITPPWDDPSLWQGQFDTPHAVWGLTAKLEELEGLRALMALMKPPSARLEKIIVCFDDDAWDPAEPTVTNGWMANATRVNELGELVVNWPEHSEFIEGTGGPIYTGI